MNAIKTASRANEQAVSEQRIRELAYQIWETEGCPDGQSDRHWGMARKLAEIETRVEPKPAPRARRISKPSAAPTASPQSASTPQPPSAIQPVGSPQKEAPIILPPAQPPTRSRNSRNKLDA